MWSVVIIGRQEYPLQRQGTVLLRISSPMLYLSYILSSMHVIMLNFKPGPSCSKGARADNAIHWINHYLLDSAIGFPNTYPTEAWCSTERIRNITYFLFYSWRIILIVILLKVVTYSWDGLIWKDRLQNSPYFCVFKYARAVKRKVWNEAENRERDWGETLKIRTVRFAYVVFVRMNDFPVIGYSCFAHRIAAEPNVITLVVNISTCTYNWKGLINESTFPVHLYLVS